MMTMVTARMMVMMTVQKTTMITMEQSKDLPAGVSVNVARAFLVYGGFVTGPVTHYFYILLDRLVNVIKCFGKMFIFV